MEPEIQGLPLYFASFAIAKDKQEGMGRKKPVSLIFLCPHRRVAGGLRPPAKGYHEGAGHPAVPDDFSGRNFNKISIS